MTTTTTPAAALRDLSDEDFRSGYGCDRFTASVLGNRMNYIVGHMAAGLLRHPVDGGAWLGLVRSMLDEARCVAAHAERPRWRTG